GARTGIPGDAPQGRGAAPGRRGRHRDEGGVVTSKRTVVAVAALGVILLVVSGSQDWVSGVVHDAVLADADVSLRGSKVAPACIGAAFVGAAAVLAALTTGRVARWFAAALVPLS